jgi:hypothetical protein
VNAPRANGEPSVFVLQGTARRGVDSQNWPHWALDFPLTHILSLKIIKFLSRILNKSQLKENICELIR